MHNPNSQAAHNENVVEKIAQAPCSMSTMEVLQYCLAQRNELLSSTRAIDPLDATLITLDLDKSTCRIPSKFSFQIKVTSHGKNFFQTIVDEGASTCFVSFKFWQALGSPTLVQSHTVWKSFDGHPFSPNKIIVAYPIEWGGQTITTDVEVVDVPIDYTFLLGCIWIHVKIDIVSSESWVIWFPH